MNSDVRITSGLIDGHPVVTIAVTDQVGVHAEYDFDVKGARGIAHDLLNAANAVERMAYYRHHNSRPH